MTTSPPPAPPRQPSKPKASTHVTFGAAPKEFGHRIVLYGPGGIGKTTLAATAPGPVAFFDLDDSLPVLAGQLDGCDVRSVSGIECWTDLMNALFVGGWDDIRTIVIDSATKAEEMAVAHTLKTVPDDKGNHVERIESYGYGKGYSHVYDTFLPLLAALTLHIRAGRNVILVSHDCTATVPNPSGEDWIRYEPRLQGPTSGKASIRLRVREWADHVLFIGYDLDVKDGKGRGSGTRTVYPSELPFCMAKSRTLADSMPLTKFDTTLWKKLLGASGK